MNLFEYAEHLLHTITKAKAQENGRKLRRQSRKLQRKVQKELDKQAKYIIREAKKLLNKKSLNNDIDEIFDKLPVKKMEIEIIASASLALDFGAKFRINKLKLGEVGISFDLSHPEAIKYLKTGRPLVLAKMADTTKDLIKPILVEGIEKGLSPTALATEISEHFAFSESRSSMIATNEIGQAYAKGNNIVMHDLKKAGFKAEKSWITAGAGRSNPRPEHDVNEEDGWIELDDSFSGDGADTAPHGINCRCDTLYTYK